MTPFLRWILPLIAFLGAVAYWNGISFGSKEISILIKMIPALAMAAHVALWSGWKGWAMTGALVLHAAGDGFLNLGGTYFLAGMGAFFLGHFGYIGAFWPHRRPWREIPGWNKGLILGVVVVMAGLTAFLWPKMPPVLNIASPIYSIGLTAMGVAALFGKWKGPWVMIGALLFMFSDVQIGLEKFLEEETLSFLIWPTYAAAQILMPLGWLGSFSPQSFSPQRHEGHEEIAANGG